MILTIANFFYYLFTLETSHFSDTSSIGNVFSTLWKSLSEWLFNLGGGGSSVSVEFTPDLFEILAVVLSFVLLLGLALWIVRVVWRLFTLR